MGQVFSVSLFVHNDNQRAQKGLFLKVLGKGFEPLNLSFSENFGAKVAQIGEQQKIDKWRKLWYNILVKVKIESSKN